MLVLPGLDQVIERGYTGCGNSAAVKSLERSVCLERTFSYIDSNTIAMTPEHAAYDEAKAHQIETYLRLDP